MEGLIRHLRKEYRMAVRMESAAMILRIMTVAKEHGIKRELIAKER